MTQIRYLGERKWSFVSATAETYRTNEFCHVTQRLQPRETWVRKPDFSSCLCYCSAVWSWVSHLTIPGNKVLLWWLLLGNSLHIGKNVEEPGDICSRVPNQGENNSMLLQGLHGRWVVKKEWGRNQCFDSYQGVKKELTKWGPPPTHTHIGNIRLSGLPICCTSKTCLITESPRRWLAFHALRVKSLTTSAIPHIQEPWIRASEVASLASTSQSFQSMPLHIFSFLYEPPDYFPYLTDSRSWN